MTMPAPLSPSADPAGTAGQPLTIAMVAPPWFEVPPAAYGGIEELVADLVDGLVERGHRVTLIGAGRNRTRAQRFVPVYPDPPSSRLGEPVPEVVQAAAAARAILDDDPDVVHDHTLAGPLLARGRTVPTVVTAHRSVDGDVRRYLRDLGATIDLVAISDAQQRLAPELNWVGTVHNAVDVATFPFRVDHDGYVLFMGRFSPEKGPHLAIEAARAAGWPLLLAGKCTEPAEQAYFAEAIAPRLGPDVRYVGEADAARKRQLYAGAAGLVFPITWEEPFGMVMIEAMACGTPVVALRRGSVAEVVVHGRTGLVVDAPEELPAALAGVRAIDPLECRDHVAERFHADVMVEGYERLYRALTEARALHSSGEVHLSQTGELTLG